MIWIGVLFHLFLFSSESQEYQDARKHAIEKKNCRAIALLSEKDCPWSAKLDTEILSKKEFCDRLEGKLLLTKKIEQTEAPGILLLSPQGEEIGRVEYLPLSPADYADYLLQKISDWEELAAAAIHPQLPLESLKALYQKAVRLGKYREELLEAGLKCDENNPYFLLEHYALLIEKGAKMRHPEIHKVRKKIQESDPKNERGLLRELAILDFQILIRNLRKRYDPEVALEPLRVYLRDYGDADSQNIWRLEMMMSQYLLSKGRHQAALEHAEASYQSAPEEEKTALLQSIHYLKGLK